MHERGASKNLILFVFILIGILILSSFVFVFAQENESNEVTNDNEGIEDDINEQEDDVDGAIGDEDNFEDENEIDKVNEGFEEDEPSELNNDAELSIGAGITPDSGFYFVEEAILSKFRDELKNREKKIAEIRVMIQEGNVEAAKIALERYKEYAENLEKEVDPDKQEEARRSAAAIRNVLREIENEIPDENKQEFVDDIIEREGKIITAVEIASKIKELCSQLSSLDPAEYSRICRIDEDTPQWQKKLNRDLTEEQRKEAQQFGEIMGECFRTQGKQCRCDDISIKPFANRCSVVAPLASQCDQGDENACEAMDEATEGLEDLLPDYLQDVMADIERKYGEDQFDLHIPAECREEGATNARDCMKVMFRLNAPEECVKALDEGRIDLSNEREARQACEEIMFTENAPEECIDAGLKDPKECGKLMFRENAPEECIEAGLTGENRNDHRKCEEIMRSLGGDRRGPGPREGFNSDCKGIKNPEERLKCYDGALESHGEGRNYGGWPPQCEQAQALTRESCEVVMREFGEKQRQGFEERYGETKERERQCAESCNGAWSFSNGECICRAESDEDRYRRPQQEFIPRENFIPGQEEFRPPTQEQQPQQPPVTETQPTPETTQPPTESTTETHTESTTTTSESSTSTSGTESSGTSGSSGTETSGTTGGVISVDNEFFNYYYK